MPVYIYLCKKCEKTEDVMKSFSEFDRKELCATCQEEMERQITSTAAIHFKGRGFYATEYKKNK